MRCRRRLLVAPAAATAVAAPLRIIVATHRLVPNGAPGPAAGGRAHRGSHLASPKVDAVTVLRRRLLHRGGGGGVGGLEERPALGAILLGLLSSGLRSVVWEGRGKGSQEAAD